jgi:hypothetical protein
MRGCVLTQRMSCRKETMIEILDMIGPRYGGVEGYMQQQCGFNSNDIERIRDNLIDIGQERRSSLSLATRI